MLQRQKKIKRIKNKNKIKNPKDSTARNQQPICTIMAMEAYTSKYPDKIHTDVLSDARETCYKVQVIHFHIIHTIYVSNYY